MSAVIAFDSHRFVKTLTASNLTEAQTEALARAEKAVRDHDNVVLERQDAEVSLDAIETHPRRTSGCAPRWRNTAGFKR